MDISVVIVTYNEEKNIEGCLESILMQKYFDGQWEILVIDGDSHDNTVKIVLDKQKESSIIKLITNFKREISYGRNLGIKESQYPFIAFTDADCIVPEDWLKRLSMEYKNIFEIDKRIAGVGGSNMPPSALSTFHQALGVYLDSFLGCFNSVQGRNFLKTRKVDSLSCANALYSKEALFKIKGFDEKMGNISEDFDLNFRLRKNAYNLYFVPFMAVFHKLRPNLSAWLKNIALYGRGRAIVSFKHRLFLCPFFILPMCFIVSMVIMPFGMVNPGFFIPLLYFPVMCLYVFIILLKKRKIFLFRKTLTIFISTHFVYAFSLLSKSLQICLRHNVKAMLIL